MIYFYKAINFSVFYGWYLMIKERKNTSQQHQINIKIFVCVCVSLIPYKCILFFHHHHFTFVCMLQCFGRKKKGTKKYNLSLQSRVKNCLKEQTSFCILRLFLLYFKIIKRKILIPYQTFQPLSIYNVLYILCIIQQKESSIQKIGQHKMKNRA